MIQIFLHSSLAATTVLLGATLHFMFAVIFPYAREFLFLQISAFFMH